MYLPKVSLKTRQLASSVMFRLLSTERVYDFEYCDLQTHDVHIHFVDLPPHLNSMQKSIVSRCHDIIIRYDAIVEENLPLVSPDANTLAYRKGIHPNKDFDTNRYTGSLTPFGRVKRPFASKALINAAHDGIIKHMARFSVLPSSNKSIANYESKTL